MDDNTEIGQMVEDVRSVKDLAADLLQISAETASKPRGPGRLFQPGQSGNPAGRPHGIRNRAALLARAMFGEEAET